MKAVYYRKELLAAFGMVSGVVPARSPKPILQNVKLTATPGTGSVLMGTDLEVGIRHQVVGGEIDEPGDVLLPTAQFGAIIRASEDAEISIKSDGEHLIVRGERSEFKLAIEDPALFPDVPEFTATSYHIVAAADLKKLIRRTIFATDVESTRYALGGALVELAGDSIAMVGTDGRRLARMTATVDTENGPADITGSPVIPVKALKLIERSLTDSDPPVHMAIQSGSSVLVRTESAVIYSRLVEGRFPRYQDVIPVGADIRIPLDVKPLRMAVDQASIVTSEDSRGVDFSFGGNFLALASQSAGVGSSHIKMPIDYDGKPVTITFDPGYLSQALGTMDESTVLTAELVDAKTAVVLKTECGYLYVVMPLTRS